MNEELKATRWLQAITQRLDAIEAEQKLAAARDKNLHERIENEHAILAGLNDGFKRLFSAVAALQSAVETIGTRPN